MYEYTMDNYYKFFYCWEGLPIGYFDTTVDYDRRPVPYKGKWKFDLNLYRFRCKRKVKPLHIECCIAAEEIYENRNGLPINVLMSGGIDSEIVATSFAKTKIPFEVYILQFEKNLNIHDISYAISFCETNKIKYNLVSIDIEKFLNEKAYEYAKFADTCCVEILSSLWLADQVPGLPIIGSGEPFFIKENGKWFYREHERIAGFYKHFMYQARPAIPGFFQYTQEILASYSTTDLIFKLVENELDRRITSSRPIKFDILKKYYPMLYPRKKYTGYEKLNNKIRTLRKKFELIFGNDNVDIEYNHFVKYLLGSGYDSV